MQTTNYIALAQMLKTGILFLVFSIVLIYIFKKLIKYFRKGTTDPIDFSAVSSLLSLGLTVMLLSPKVNLLFESIFGLFSHFFDYMSFLILMSSNTNPSDLTFPSDITRFKFADAIIIFSVWLFINTLLNIFFQRSNTANSPRIFSDSLFAKNTFVVFLLSFSIYLCVASIVAIPEFQALESSEFNNDELTEFTKEIEQQTGYVKEDLLMEEFSTNDLRIEQSNKIYDDFNTRIKSYNQIINMLWKDHEQRKINAIDAYKSAFLEKTASKERIKYRSILKKWVQDRASNFVIFVYYQPKFESIVRRVTMDVTRIEKDSTMNNPKDIEKMYDPLYDVLEDWEKDMSDLEGNIFKVRNQNYGIPDKPKIGEQYGIFQSMSGWLLSTESMSLALIVGLFAFGLLGSIGSTFIRQRIKHGDDSGSKDFIPNLPAVLINGISSAIVVFLAVKGMLVIFSGKDSGVNPYMLFFTCLVAAVFSEDVWKWAQKKLNDQLNNIVDSLPPPNTELPQPEAEANETQSAEEQKESKPLPITDETKPENEP